MVDYYFEARKAGLVPFQTYITSRKEAVRRAAKWRAEGWKVTVTVYDPEVGKYVGTDI